MGSDESPDSDDVSFEEDIVGKKLFLFIFIYFTLKGKRRQKRKKKKPKRKKQKEFWKNKTGKVYMINNLNFFVVY